VGGGLSSPMRHVYLGRRLVLCRSHSLSFIYAMQGSCGSALIGIYGEYYRRCTQRALAHSPDIHFHSWYSCSLSTGW